MRMHTLVWFAGLFNALAGVFIHSDILCFGGVMLMLGNLLGLWGSEEWLN